MALLIGIEPMFYTYQVHVLPFNDSSVMEPPIGYDPMPKRYECFILPSKLWRHWYWH